MSDVPFQDEPEVYLPDETIVKDKYAKAENNPGFKRCMHCGQSLPPNEDGSQRWRKQPTPCDDCVNRHKNTSIKDKQ